MKPIQKIALMQILLSALSGAVLAVHRNIDPSGEHMAIVAVAAVVLLFLYSLGTWQLKKKKNLQPQPIGRPGFGLLAAAGFLYLIAAAAFLLQMEGSTMLRAVTALFALFTGGATLVRLLSRDDGKIAAVFSLIPVFFHSYLALMVYRSNADNPYLATYSYEIFVLLMALLGCYSAAAGRFSNSGRIFLPIFSSVSLAFVTQELLTAALQWERFLSVPAISLGIFPTLLGCWMLVACGLLYPPAYDSSLAATANG